MAKNKGFAAVIQITPEAKASEVANQKQAAMTALIQSIIEAGDSVRRVS